MTNTLTDYDRVRIACAEFLGYKVHLNFAQPCDGDAVHVVMLPKGTPKYLEKSIECDHVEAAIYVLPDPASNPEHAAELLTRLFSEGWEVFTAISEQNNVHLSIHHKNGSEHANPGPFVGMAPVEKWNAALARAVADMQGVKHESS